MEGSPFSLGGSDIDMSMNSDEDAGAYRHEWFEKDKPDLCVQMKTPKQKSIQSPRLGASPDMMANSTLSLEALLVSPITTEVPEPSLSVTIAATTSTSASAVKPAMIMNAIDNAESSSTVTTSSTSDVASDKENDDDVNANGKRKESAMSTTTTPSNSNTAPKKLKTTGPYDANLAPAQYPYGHGH
jgi:hypothetical protein